MEEYPLDYNGIYNGPHHDTAITEMGVAAPFDSSTTYKKYDYVTKDNHLYRCTANTFSGPWNDLSWKPTTCLEEIREILGEYNGNEKLTIQVSVNKGTGIVAGKTIKVHFSAGSQSTDTILTLDSDGKATMNIPYGDIYRIEPTSMEGYLVFNTAYYTAILPSRVISIRYIQLDNGYYIIKNDKSLVPYLEWTGSGTDAWGFMYTDSNMTGDNSIVVCKNMSTGSGVFQPEYVDCPTVTNRANATQANADYDGKSQCEAWVTWAETPDTVTGETPIQKYNRVYSKSVDINGYLPAIRIAYNKTVTIGGNTIHGYLPAMGQLRFMCDPGNRELFNYVAGLIGMTFPSIDSGTWWSCSENRSSNCWYLYNGSTDSNNKTYSRSVFPLYALSDLNL